MTQYIEREALLDDIDAAMQNTGMGIIVRQALKRYVKRQPASDVSEVVRCKNCKNYELMKSGNSHFCNEFGGRVTEEDFCSRAQKMDGGTNDDSKKSVRASE